MNLIRRNSTPATNYWPGSIEDRFGRLVENMFEDMIAPLSAASAPLAWDNAIAPRLHVTETDQTYEIEAEMPSVKKEDVKVAVDGQRVTIEGECKQDDQQDGKQDGQQGSARKVLYSERRAQRFIRSFTLPSDVDDANAQAHMENGVLTLSLPKKQESAPKRLTIS